MNHLGRDSHISLAGLSLCGIHSAGRTASGPTQCGVTLIEVLVTLLLVSIGLVGSLALQARAMQDNQSAYLRSQAVHMATDIADRIRLNPVAAKADKYNISWTSVPAGFSAKAGQLADRDLYGWLTWMKTGLGARAQAEISNTGDNFTITLRWHDQRHRRVDSQGQQNGPQFSTFQLQMEL